MGPNIFFFVQFAMLDGKLHTETVSALKSFKTMAERTPSFNVIIGHLRKDGHKDRFTRDEMRAILEEADLLPQIHRIVETQTGVGMNKWLHDNMGIGQYGDRSLTAAKLIGPAGIGWVN